MRSGVGAVPSHRGMMESSRWPKEERNCSRLMVIPSFASVFRQEIQWNSSESINVPSMSQRTARSVPIYEISIEDVFLKMSARQLAEERKVYLARCGAALN